MDTVDAARWRHEVQRITEALGPIGYEHSWSNDPERRREAGIPEDVQVATKPRLAWERIETALDARITASWVTGDEAYGQDPHLRLALK